MGFVHHVLDTGARRTLTEAPYGFTDSHPRVSPDGSSVAFARTGSGRAGLFVVSMGGGEPTDRRLEHRVHRRSVVDPGRPGNTLRTIRDERPATSSRGGRRRRACGRQPGHSTGFRCAVGIESRGRQGYRLALVSDQPDLGLRMMDLHGTLRGNTITSDVPFSDSTRFDMPGRFSPDGTQVAFMSDRSGSQQVWVAHRDGSGLRVLTRLQGATVNVGAWSPDGRWVAFDATMNGNRDIYVVGANGVLLNGLPTERAPKAIPSGRATGAGFTTPPMRRGARKSGRCAPTATIGCSSRGRWASPATSIAGSATSSSSTGFDSAFVITAVPR